MGGYVAFELLRRWRKRVSALILIATRAEADTPEGRRAREAAAQQARELGAEAIADAMLPNMLAAGTRERDPELMARVRRLMADTPVAGIGGALAAMRDRPDSTPLLPTLEDLPTLVLAGGDDCLIPVERVRAMADRIPGARFEVVPGAAHLPMLEAPQPTTTAIRTFLASLG
jgi:3-oxoadipate enol-lactonase